MRTETRLVWLAALALAALGSRPARASSCIPGFDYAMFAKSSIQVQGNAGTDSYDSTAGSYATTSSCSDADIGTNSISSAAAQIQSNSTVICGDAAVGAGGNPGTVITGNGNIIGTRAAQTTNMSLPDIMIPSLPNGSPFSPDYTNSSTTLVSNRTYGDVKCKNGKLTLHAGKYVVKSITLTANCELELGSGPVEIYFTESLKMQAGVIANPTNIPGNLVLYGGPAAATVEVQGGVDASFAVYSPSANCQLQGNADLYGALVCANVQVQGNAHVHYDRALRNLAGGGFGCPPIEVSRASPVIAQLGTLEAVVQGTYEVPRGTPTVIETTADVSGFTFPYIKGHMRARTAASIATTSSAFSAGTVLFDAGATGKIPAVNHAGCTSFTGSCRNVFTTTTSPSANGTTLRPAMVQLQDTNASAIGALIAPTSVVSGIGTAQWVTLVRRVLAGEPDGVGGYLPKLGGVDRSTVAVIQASATAGVPTRPTIAYFGGTDGMLHATCASVGGTTPSASNICPSLGTELWAFLPRTQLPLIRRNRARIDGSVRVVDAFGDFDSPATGRRSFRTILTFQTGFADSTVAGASPAVYALDVSDPANPVILWEYTTPSAPAAFEVGVGLAIASGHVLVGGQPTNLVIAQTRNGGTGGPGIVVDAINLETGAKRWRFEFPYPSPPRGNAADLPLPITGVPGGAVALDLRRQGFVTDVAFGDLYGDLWLLDVATGTSRTGAGVPLFQFSSNKHPIGAVPAIYSDGNRQFAVFGSGGYVDPTLASWSAGTQSLISVNLGSTGPFPLTETSLDLAFKQDLRAGDDAFAQILVVGAQLFLTTDSGDVNAASYGTSGDTGRVIIYDLATAATTVVVNRGGAGSLAGSGTALYSSSGDRQQRLATGAATTVGPTVDTSTLPGLSRELWLRTE